MTGSGDGSRRNERPAGSGGARSSSGGSRSGAEHRAQLEQRAYDPRREERRRAARVALPDDVEGRMLDAEVRAELRPLSKDTADLVARHLVMTGRLVDEDPEQALAHARAARAMAGRIGPVREAVGLAAYAAQDWADALTELRAARRITGSATHLAVMADCERALGRPERALAYGNDVAVDSLAAAERVELIIVLSGARRDLGQSEAAVLLLQEPARRTKPGRDWAARLYYAYADALLAAGRDDDARQWFAGAADSDIDARTDADERLLELDGISVQDLETPDDDAAQTAADHLTPRDEALLLEVGRRASQRGERPPAADQQGAEATPPAAPSASTRPEKVAEVVFSEAVERSEPDNASS